MNTLATTIEQSKHLLKLGLDPNTGDMNWFGNEKIGVPYDLELLSYKKRSMYHHCLPAWSLSALLEVMPTNIGDYDLYVTKHRYVDGGHGYNVEYNRGFTISVLHKETNRDLVTAVYEMVCWLLEQGYIKGGCEQ